MAMHSVFPDSTIIYKQVNFTIYSCLLEFILSYMQVQKRSHVLTLRTLFHDHLFSILFISTGVFLVNYVLLSSAASESSHNVIHSFHDAVDLMNQVCESSFYSINPNIKITIMPFGVLSIH